MKDDPPEVDTFVLGGPEWVTNITISRTPEEAAAALYPNDISWEPYGPDHITLIQRAAYVRGDAAGYARAIEECAQFAHAVARETSHKVGMSTGSAMRVSIALIIEKRIRALTSGKEQPLATAESNILRHALEIIAGERQCLDNLMSNAEVARSALRVLTSGKKQP